jgi:hypothetical protein
MKVLAVEPFDIFGSVPAFDVVIDTAVVTKLDESPIRQEIVQVEIL